MNSNSENAKGWANRGLVIRLGSLLAFILIWVLAAFSLNDNQILPTPFMVMAEIGHEAATGRLLRHLSATLFRVVCSFVIAMGIGVILGLLMGRNGNQRNRANDWLDPWLIIFLNLPALVVIVLCYLWIGLNEVAAIAAVAINKIPLVTAMIREGARAFDPGLDAMARSFRVKRFTSLRHILLPQLAPHLAASSRSGLALIWKIVLVVEFLGRPNGIGFQIHLGFENFNVTLVLAYSLTFVAVMLLIEFFVLQPLERRANRWRQA